MAFIDGNISDLFFNTDHQEAAVFDSAGQFTDYDTAKLRDEAQMFLNCLDRLGVRTPAVDDLTADFLARC